MVKDGKDTSQGALMSACSVKVKYFCGALIMVAFFINFVDQWRALSEDEKSKYEEIAREDRERYDEECAVSKYDIRRVKNSHVIEFLQIRDEEALKRQEERRKANSLGETETRLRGSTVSALRISHLKIFYLRISACQHRCNYL